MHIYIYIRIYVYTCIYLNLPKRVNMIISIYPCCYTPINIVLAAYTSPNVFREVMGTRTGWEVSDHFPPRRGCP